jgi:hypothetical protein
MLTNVIKIMNERDKWGKKSGKGREKTGISGIK